MGCYNNKFIETPNLDELAKEGIQFKNAYAAAPLCSPTRASIITGCNPTRINLT
jgi:arylsulfatase A